MVMSTGYGIAQEIVQARAPSRSVKWKKLKIVLALLLVAAYRRSVRCQCVMMYVGGALGVRIPTRLVYYVIQLIHRVSSKETNQPSHITTQATYNIKEA